MVGDDIGLIVNKLRVEFSIFIVILIGKISPPQNILSMQFFGGFNLLTVSKKVNILQQTIEI